MNAHTDIKDNILIWWNAMFYCYTICVVNSVCTEKFGKVLCGGVVIISMFSFTDVWTILANNVCTPALSAVRGGSIFVFQYIHTIIIATTQFAI